MKIVSLSPWPDGSPTDTVCGLGAIFLSPNKTSLVRSLSVLRAFWFLLRPLKYSFHFQPRSPSPLSPSVSTCTSGYLNLFSLFLLLHFHFSSPSLVPFIIHRERESQLHLILFLDYTPHTIPLLCHHVRPDSPVALLQGPERRAVAPPNHLMESGFDSFSPAPLERRGQRKQFPFYSKSVLTFYITRMARRDMGDRVGRWRVGVRSFNDSSSSDSNWAFTNSTSYATPSFRTTVTRKNVWRMKQQPTLQRHCDFVSHQSLPVQQSARSWPPPLPGLSGTFTSSTQKSQSPSLQGQSYSPLTLPTKDE